jgi:hypothetical protein
MDTVAVCDMASRPGRITTTQDEGLEIAIEYPLATCVSFSGDVLGAAPGSSLNAAGSNLPPVIALKISFR